MTRSPGRPPSVGESGTAVRITVRLSAKQDRKLARIAKRGKCTRVQAIRAWIEANG